MRAPVRVDRRTECVFTPKVVWDSVVWERVVVKNAVIESCAAVRNIHGTFNGSVTSKETVCKMGLTEIYYHSSAMHFSVVFKDTVRKVRWAIRLDDDRAFTVSERNPLEKDTCAIEKELTLLKDAVIAELSVRSALDSNGVRFVRGNAVVHMENRVGAKDKHCLVVVDSVDAALDDGLELNKVAVAFKSSVGAWNRLVGYRCTNKGRFRCKKQKQTTTEKKRLAMAEGHHAISRRSTLENHFEEK